MRGVGSASFFVRLKPQHRDGRGDAYAVAHRFWEFSSFFLAPVRLAIALVYLYRQVSSSAPAADIVLRYCPFPRRILGWSALTAVGVTIIVYLLNYPLGKYDVYVRGDALSRDKPPKTQNPPSIVAHAPKLEGGRPADEHRERAVPERPLPQILRLG